MTKRIDLSNQRFGKLTVIPNSFQRKRNQTYWSCVCDCGARVDVLAANIKRGNTRSCGCLHKEVAAQSAKHGMEGTRVYRAWQLMKNRCTNPKSVQFPRYGGRGIMVCEEWRDDFTAFYTAVGDPPTRNHTLDRVDNDGNYEPGNVRWASKKKQANNRSSNRVIHFRGQSKTLAEWSRETGLSGPVIWHRLGNGWSVEEALTCPLLKGRTRKNMRGR